jgi:hypothetical protein
MEEMLVDRVVSAAVRSARVLWFGSEAFARKDAFWGSNVDRVLRYQTTTDRQLTKAIELLENLQRKRKARGGEETDSGSQSGGAPMNPCDMPWTPGSGDQERFASEPSNLPSTRQVPVALSSEAIARRSCAPTFGAVSPVREENSGGAPQETEKCKTKPPTGSLGWEAGDMGHEEARPKRSLTEIAERVAGLAASPEPNTEPVTTSSSGNKSPDPTVPGTTQDEILDCL